MVSATEAVWMRQTLHPIQVLTMTTGDLGKAMLKGITKSSISSLYTPVPWAKVGYLVSVQSEAAAQALVQEDFAEAIKLEILQRQNVQVAMRSDIIILACPPGAVKTVLSEKGMADALSQNILVSLAAGVTIAQIADALYHDPGNKTDHHDQNRCHIVRAMPNIAASLGTSATGIALPTNPALPKDTIRLVDSFFQAVGGITHIPESQMDAASVVCGASPAFMAMFCDAIIDGAVAGGLPRAQAEIMTAQALASTASLLAADGGGKKPSEVRENICANPGITIGGILNLEKGGVRGSISGAVRDAILAARSLS